GQVSRKKQEYEMKPMLIILAMVGLNAHALKIDSGSSSTEFRVEGRVVSAADATSAALKGSTVYKCKSKSAAKGKTFFGTDGKALGDVVECTPQELLINAKSGGVKFKAVKK